MNGWECPFWRFCQRSQQPPLASVPLWWHHITVILACFIWANPPWPGISKPPGLDTVFPTRKCPNQLKKSWRKQWLYNKNISQDFQFVSTFFFFYPCGVHCHIHVIWYTQKWSNLCLSQHVYFTRLMVNHKLSWEMWQTLLLTAGQLQRKLNSYWECYVWCGI